MTYYYNSMKKDRFRLGRKNGLICPHPLHEFSRTEIIHIEQTIKYVQWNESSLVSCRIAVHAQTFIQMIRHRINKSLRYISTHTIPLLQEHFFVLWMICFSNSYNMCSMGFKSGEKRVFQSLFCFNQSFMILAVFRIIIMLKNECVFQIKFLTSL